MIHKYSNHDIFFQLEKLNIVCHLKYYFIFLLYKFQLFCDISSNSKSILIFHYKYRLPDDQLSFSLVGPAPTFDSAEFVGGCRVVLTFSDTITEVDSCSDALSSQTVAKLGDCMSISSV